MKHTVQKLLCLILSVGMLVASLAIAPAAELKGSETAKTINDYLVTHWDFEGDTTEEQLKDKAPASNKDNKNVEQLTIFKSNDSAVSIANGTASIQPDSGSYLWLNNENFGSFDARVISGSTYYFNFTFSGTNTGFAYLMQIPGIFRIFRHGNGDFRIQFYKDSLGGATDPAAVSGLPKVNPGDDVHLAISVGGYDSSSGTLPCDIYVSTDGVNYSKASAKVPVAIWRDGNGRSVASSTGNGVYIGNWSSKTDTGLDFAFKDIKCYRKSLTEAQIPEISRLDPAAPVVIGSQETAVVDGAQSIRLIAAISSTQYTEAGYTVKVSYNNGTEDVLKTLNKSCTAVYKSLTADEGEGIVEIQAESLGGAYLMALTIDKVPCNKGKIQFEVTAYAVDENGRHESIPVLFTYENGDFVSAVKQ